MASERYYRSVENAFRHVPRQYDRVPTPILHRLYRDAWSTWNSLNYLDEHLLALLRLMLNEPAEVEQADAEQIRLAYGIKEAA